MEILEYRWEVDMAKNVQQLLSEKNPGGARDAYECYFAQFKRDCESTQELHRTRPSAMTTMRLEELDDFWRHVCGPLNEMISKAEGK